MGFLIGSSCFLQTPISHLPSSSFPHIKNVNNYNKHRRTMVVVSHLHGNQDEEVDFCRKRAILVLGISALPFFQLKATASDEISVKEEQDTRVPEENQSTELLQGQAPSNPILSLLNVVGIIGSGILGALYTLAQKDRTTTEATIESLKNKVIEKDAAMVSQRKQFEKKLLSEQEEKARQNEKAKEQQSSLSNQLTSAKSTITGLGKELQSEKRLAAELKTQIDKLEGELTRTGDDNKILREKLKEKLEVMDVLEDRINLLTLEIKEKEENVQTLNSLLKEKESESTDLFFINKRTKEDLTEANSQIGSLNEELLKYQSDIESKKYSIDDLTKKVTSLTTERDDIQRNLEKLQEDYSHLSSSSEKKAALDAQLLGETENELHHVEEKLKLALEEVSKKQDSVLLVTQERDSLKSLLEDEVNNVNSLRCELQTTQETLQSSRSEISDLLEQLRKSRLKCEELASDVSRVKTELDEVRGSLTTDLEEERSSSKLLLKELNLAKKDIESTKEELQKVCDELASMTESRDNLKKELVDVYKKAETERDTVATLNVQLEAYEKKINEDKEARNNLEIHLDEATKSLDKVNKNVLLLSKELEIANSRLENLEVEKDMVYKALTEQKRLSGEARENIEDAHDIIMKLGKEREHLDKRVRKLEDELAVAKGEILKLRSRKSSPRKKATGTESESDDGGVSVKKVSRRKKRVVACLPMMLLPSREFLE